MSKEGKIPSLLCPECTDTSAKPVTTEQANFIMGLLGPMEVKCSVCEDAFKYTDELERQHQCKCQVCDCLIKEGAYLLNGGEHDCVVALKERMAKLVTTM